MAWGPITVEGRTPLAGEKFINADQRTVAGRYFEGMKIPLIAGRYFNETDTRTNPRAIIVDQHMAEQLWPGEDAVGKRIRTGGIDANSNAPWLTVVGVVGNVKQDTLDSDSRIAFYYPHSQVTSRALTVVMRGSSDTAALRRELSALDPDLPIYKVRTMSARVDESLARRRFSMLLLTLFAALALGLAAIGVYGVMSFLVGQSTREFGIRIALGAAPVEILRMVLRQGMMVSAIGIVAGTLGALGLTRFMQSLLFGVSHTDAATFAGIVLLLSLIALLACYIPARRAARVDPVISLRND
jgi:predicted permease